MQNSTIHIAQDNRAIDDALLSRGLGTAGGPKTSRTYCGKLVKARNEVARLFGDEIAETCGTIIQYLAAATIYDRYAELLEQRLRHPPTIPNRPLSQTAPASASLRSRLKEKRRIHREYLIHLTTPPSGDRQ